MQFKIRLLIYFSFKSAFELNANKECGYARWSVGVEMKMNPVYNNDCADCEGKTFMQSKFVKEDLIFLKLLA